MEQTAAAIHKRREGSSERDSMSDDDDDSKSDSADSNGRQTDDCLRRNQLGVKQQLDEEQEKLLNELPEEYKDMFGAIGFGKWGKRWLPALIRGPYDVGPGKTRQQWMSMYEKLKQSNRLSHMTYLIYWYGAQRRDEFYSFISPKNFIAYDDKEKLKKQKVTTKYPAAIQEKLDNGTPLTAADEDSIRELKELFEDVEKKPEDRKRGDINFLESWQLVTMEDVNECLSYGSESDSDKSEEKKPFVVKKKKGKPGPKPKSKPAAKKRKRSDDAEEETDKDKSTKRTARAKRTTKATGKKSTDSKDSEEKPQKVKKKGKQRGVEGMIQTSQEEKTFKLCRQAYLPTIKTWTSLIKNKDISHVIQHLEKTVTNQMTSYSSSFILRCGLQDLVTQTRLLLEEIEPENEMANAAQKLKPMFDEIMDAKETSTEKSEDTAQHEQEEDCADDNILSEEEEPFAPIEPEPIAKKATKKGKRKTVDQEKAKIVKKNQKVKHKIINKPSKTYRPLVNSWKFALSSKDADELSRSIQAVHKAVNNYKSDSHFFSEMHTLIKGTKDFLKADEGNPSFLDDAKVRLKSLKQTLKELYNANGHAGPSKGTMPRVADADLDFSERSKGAKATKENGSVDNSEKKEEKRINESDTAPKDVPSNDSNADAIKVLSPTKVQAPSQKMERKIFSLGSMIRPNSKSSAIADIKTTVQTPSAPLPETDTKLLGSSRVSTPGQNIERKSFSLGNMIRSNSKSSTLDETKSGVPQKAATTELMPEPKHGVQHAKEKPSWMVEIVYPPKPIDSRRQTAIDFLLGSETTQQNVALLLNFEAICVSIEAAVFDWARDTFSSTEWESHYWAKVHAVVAALSSTPTREKALIRRIASNEFLQANEILKLDLERLTESFEKSPMVAPSSDSL